MDSPPLLEKVCSWRKRSNLRDWRSIAVLQAELTFNSMGVILNMSGLSDKETDRTKSKDVGPFRETEITLVVILQKLVAEMNATNAEHDGHQGTGARVSQFALMPGEECRMETPFVHIVSDLVLGMERELEESTTSNMTGTDQSLSGDAPCIPHVNFSTEPDQVQIFNSLSSGVEDNANEKIERAEEDWVKNHLQSSLSSLPVASDTNSSSDS